MCPHKTAHKTNPAIGLVIENPELIIEIVDIITLDISMFGKPSSRFAYYYERILYELKLDPPKSYESHIKKFVVEKYPEIGKYFGLSQITVA